jgi:hypothetical protein
LVAASGDNTPVRLAAGSNGQMLMADSSATAGLRYVDPPTNRNLIINGHMAVHQRGTSVASAPAGYSTADRWNQQSGSLGVYTQSVETDAPTGSGFNKSFKMLCTTAETTLTGTRFVAIEHRIEGQDLQRVRKGTSDAQQLTVSFWVKSNVTGTYVANLADNDNSRSVSATYSVSSSATWERKTITFPADTTGAITNDNTTGMTMTFWLAAGTDFTSGTLNTTWASTTNANRAVGQTNLSASTNNYWQVTGVQLEVGPVATPFEFEPYDTTLRKCQRYFQKCVRSWPAAILSAYATSAAWGPVLFKQTMRATPTVTLGTTGSGAGQISATLAGSNWPTTIGVNAAEDITEDGFSFKCSGYTGAFTAGDAVIVASNGSATLYTASAEL